jgi:hypothetical protein
MNLTEIENSQDVSWETASTGWPETSYSEEKWLACTKEKVVPYGEYVVVGVEYTYPHKQNDGSYYDYSNARIRCSSIEYCDRLEKI